MQWLRGDDVFTSAAGRATAADSARARRGRGLTWGRLPEGSCRWESLRWLSRSHLVRLHGSVMWRRFRYVSPELRPQSLLVF